MNHKIVLGSGSPRREELLTLLNVPFSVILPLNEVDETPLKNEVPSQLVQRLSRAKAKAVLPALVNKMDGFETCIIITADTIVALNNIIFGKPKTTDEAFSMLKQLRDRPHHVYSAITVGCITTGQSTVKWITKLHQNDVQMRNYSDDEIWAYIDTGDPLDKAGAYGIQHEAFAPVDSFEGCFASIMGLPLGELIPILRQFGVPVNKTSGLYHKLSSIYDCCQI
ncbi:Maf family protein [Anaerolineales bacterium HSG6]|nr:Maf family protein [Anaerolineales bacterium HSG6]